MQTLADLLNTIPAIDPAAMSRAQRHIDGLLKPVGSLGRLEALAIQLAGMPGLNGVPHVGKKAVLVMCADHGVWEEGVAISPKEVTAIQAENMTRGTVVGIGANLPTDKLANKIDVVRRAITLNQPNPQDGVDVLAKVGGFDLVGMAGVMLGAASCGLPVLLDGFLSYAAALAACQMSPAIKPYLIPSHLSAEKGARIALSHLGLEPYLNMEMRLGEGSGAALAMPIIEAACAIYNNMGELAASNIVLPGNTTSDLNS
ncbi:nicotinate-nucleotide--dimethylbenzimidazole phosphoribosyltransferase [Shigella sonnei]|nr:nicotinate-nucleotide--dimethylbenzimidazole phosphoribosyltransferase [Shigella sonnei]